MHACADRIYIVGWGNTPTEPSFGGAGNDAASVKGKLVNLISSVRTLMRSEFLFFFWFYGEEVGIWGGWVCKFGIGGMRNLEG